MYKTLLLLDDEKRQYSILQTNENFEEVKMKLEEQIRIIECRTVAQAQNISSPFQYVPFDSFYK